MKVKFAFFALFFLIMACANDNTSKNKSTAHATTPAATADTATIPTSNTTKKTILFFGNSLTAAYGLDPAQGFVGLIQHRLDSLRMPYKVINAGLSGETTAGGKERVDWILKQSVDIFVLELGGNDALRGIKPEESYKNLQSIIDKVRTKYPQAKIILAGMQAPPNMGVAFTKAFREIYPKLAKENNIALIPFLLEGVGGISKLNLPDGIHPTPQGHKIVAETVWNILKNNINN